MIPIPSFQEILTAWQGPDLSRPNNFSAEQRLSAAIDWIRLAHGASGDGGISKGYDLLRKRWMPAYPETTGYTVPTLLNAALLLEKDDLRMSAFSLADFLLQCRTPEGGVAHWASSRPYPIVFDTGQVIFGWLAAFEAGGETRYLEAASQAGNWLASIQDPGGAWEKHQHLGVTKVIDTRVAWALLLLHKHTHEETFQQAAIRNLDWAIRNQDPDGWFRNCAFSNTEDPFTHTLAYTAEGLLECGCLLEEASYIHAARLTSSAFLQLQRADGSLAGTYGSGWRETSRSSCLTGNCQISHIWLRFYQLNRQQADYTAAQKALGYVARTQNINTAKSNIRGAIAGSYPIYGRYERFKYPNWATKFFIDALLLLKRIGNKNIQEFYAG